MIDNKDIEKSVDNSKIKESLRKTLTEYFKCHNLGYEDFFDQSIFFLKNDNDNFNKMSNMKFFTNLIQSTQNEEDDILKMILVRSLVKSKSVKIKVLIFIEELIITLIKLSEDQKRVDSLIKMYDAYKTKNIIEEYINNNDYKESNANEKMRSTIKTSVTEIEGLTKGEYKLSLMTGIISSKAGFLQENKEEIFDYNLNHIMIIDENEHNHLEEKESEYYFPEIDLFSYEMSGDDIITEIASPNDSGTNLIKFFLRIENLNRNYEDVMYSEQKLLIELFLHNIRPLIENHSLIKTFYTDCAIRHSIKSIIFKLKIEINFDTVTLSTILNKIVFLLKNIISFKINVDHKWKTMLKYFPELEKDITSILGVKTKIESHNYGKCLVF